MPLHLDDFVFMQDAGFEAFRGLCEVFKVLPEANVSGFGFVISGCERTDNGSESDFAEGFLCIDGEILYVPALTGVPNSFAPTFFYRLGVTYDPNGNDLFEDGVTRDTYEVRRGEAAVITNPVTYTIIEVFNQPRLEDLLVKLLGKSQGDNTPTLSYVNGWSASGTSPLTVQKKSGVVYFAGSVNYSATAPTMFTLPAGFAPDKILRFLVYRGDGVGVLTINTVGQVQFVDLSSTAGAEVDLSGVNFVV